MAKEKPKRRPRGKTDRSGAQTYLVPQFGKMLGIGRDKSYEAARLRQIPVIEVAGQLRVPKALGDAMLRGEWPPKQPEAA